MVEVLEMTTKTDYSKLTERIAKRKAQAEQLQRLVDRQVRIMNAPLLRFIRDVEKLK